MTEATTPIPLPVEVMECRVHPATIQDVIAILTEAARDRRSLRASYLNAHCSNLAATDAEYRRILNGCDLVYADGQSVVRAARRLGSRLPERASAGDFILDFCETCAKRGLRIYLLGGQEGVAEQAAQKWRGAAPALEVCGARSGYFSEAEERSIADAIRAARPDILLVGMGASRQELWMDRWAVEIDCPVVWCVGALFEYFGQGRPRAPLWMRRLGLEWLWRLVLEPRRLWRRYLVGNVRFLLRVSKAARRR